MQPERGLDPMAEDNPKSSPVAETAGETEIEIQAAREIQAVKDDLSLKTGGNMKEDPKKRGLGRGLSALLGDENEDYAALDRVRGAKDVPVEQLRPNKYQPRRYFDEQKAAELVNSIREKGVLEPLLVRRIEDDPTSYEIIAGERRWRAAQKAQLHQVPVVIKEINDAEALEISLIENIQREDLTPLDEAEGYQRLLDEFDYTQEATGRLVGKSRSHVANMLRLLTLPNSVKAYLADGRLSAGHARALVTADDPEKLAHRIVDQSLNVRDAEKLTKKPRVKAAPDPKDPDTLALENDISTALGLKVAIQFLGEKKGGEVKISYGTLEQLDEICRRLCSQGE